MSLRRSKEAKSYESASWMVFLGGVVIFLSIVSLSILFGSPSVADDADQHAAPDMVDLRKTEFKIVGAMFVSKLVGVNAQFENSVYRGLVLTVEVKKPAGEQLTLYAQDFSVHYYHGNESSDVAPCHGLSGFSSTKDVDRPMIFAASSRQSSQTGTATTKSDVVYVDLFFQGFEASTRELHLLLAQPCASPFPTSGWKE